MGLINFTPAKRSRLFKISKPKILLFFGSIFALILGNTFAASISLNSGGNVEFGQGVALTTACDDDLLVTPYSTFVNTEGGGDFIFTSLTVTRISSECDGKTFIIKAYSNGSNDPLELYETSGDGTYDELEVYDDGGDFQLVDAGLLGDDIQSSGPDGNGDYSFTVNLFTNDNPQSEALASAQDVDRITIESRDGVAPSPSPSPSPTSDPVYSFWTTQANWAGYSAQYWGQTFTIPIGASGGITSIGGIKLQTSCQEGGNPISSTVRIYSESGKTTLLATASNTVDVVVDCTVAGPFGAAVDATVTFTTPVSVVEGQQYFFELERTTPWFENFYFLGEGSDVYGGGNGYASGQSYNWFDLSFQVRFES